MPAVAGPEGFLIEQTERVFAGTIVVQLPEHLPLGEQDAAAAGPIGLDDDPRVDPRQRVVRVGAPGDVDVRVRAPRAQDLEPADGLPAPC